MSNIFVCYGLEIYGFFPDHKRRIPLFHSSNKFNIIMCTQRIQWKCCTCRSDSSFFCIWFVSFRVVANECVYSKAEIEPFLTRLQIKMGKFNFKLTHKMCSIQFYTKTICPSTHLSNHYRPCPITRTHIETPIQRLLKIFLVSAWINIICGIGVQSLLNIQIQIHIEIVEKKYINLLRMRSKCGEWHAAQAMWI